MSGMEVDTFEREAVEPFTCELYPLSNYEFCDKEPQPSKDKSWNDKILRIKSTFNDKGMRHVVEGVLLVHYRQHPHVLLFQTPNGSFKLYVYYVYILTHMI